jgi:hypothetical protein
MELSRGVARASSIDTRLRLSLCAPVISSGYCTACSCKGIAAVLYRTKGIRRIVYGRGVVCERGPLSTEEASGELFMGEVSSVREGMEFCDDKLRFAFKRHVTVAKIVHE